MTLRLIEMVLPENEGAKIKELLKEKAMLEQRHIQLPDQKVLVRILLEAEQSQAVLDLLEQQYTGKEESRMVILPVQAVFPRNETEASEKKKETEKKQPERIDREELYEGIKGAAKYSRVYLAMVVLSTIVAIVALHHNSETILIGAMVIAPLLGPSMALALGTTLGDLSLLRRAILTSIIGIVTTFALSFLIGAFIDLNLSETKLASHTRVGLGNVAVALASGCAGALAFTSGAPTILIGVMVSVSLLPPLVLFGLLLGAGEVVFAMNALSLFLMNLICINFAGIMTFLSQGIQPTTWWEKDRATKATRIAIGLWIGLSFALFGLIMLLRSL